MFCLFVCCFAIEHPDDTWNTSNSKFVLNHIATYMHVVDAVLDGGCKEPRDPGH